MVGDVRFDTGGDLPKRQKARVSAKGEISQRHSRIGCSVKPSASIARYGGQAMVARPAIS